MSATSYLELFEENPGEEEDPESSDRSRFTGKIDGKKVAAAAEIGKKGVGFVWDMFSGGAAKKGGAAQKS